MSASDKHVLDYDGLLYFKSKIYSDLKTINGAAITGGGNLLLVVANTAITGATKCKITYDSKGLVTGGADLLASDIPELSASKITSGTFDIVRISGLQEALYEKEDKSNKVTSLDNSSTDTQYPSAKVVYDNLINVREVAEGKCQTYVISYTTDIDYLKNMVNNGKKVYDKDGNDISSDITSGRYDVLISNSKFNSNSDSISVSSYSNQECIAVVYIPWMASSATSAYIYRFSDMKKGDVILVKELDVPDRWFETLLSGGIEYPYQCNKLETAKVDLSGYQTLITGNNKISSDFVDDTNSYNKFVTPTEKINIDIIKIRTTNIRYDESTGTTISGTTNLTNLIADNIQTRALNLEGGIRIYDSSYFGQTKPTGEELQLGLVGNTYLGIDWAGGIKFPELPLFDRDWFNKANNLLGNLSVNSIGDAIFVNTTLTLDSALNLHDNVYASEGKYIYLGHTGGLNFPSGNLDKDWFNTVSAYATTKQDTLVSGTNIKTINGASLMGSGDIIISGGASTWGNITGILSNQTDLQNALDAKYVKPASGIPDSDLANSYQETLVSGLNIKTINGTSLLGSGDILVSATTYINGNGINISNGEIKLANDIIVGDPGYYGKLGVKGAYCDAQLVGDGYGLISINENYYDPIDGSLTNSYQIYIPRKSGTFALMSDIPSTPTYYEHGIELTNGTFDIFFNIVNTYSSGYGWGDFTSLASYLKTLPNGAKIVASGNVSGNIAVALSKDNDANTMTLIYLINGSKNYLTINLDAPTNYSCYDAPRPLQ